MSTAQKMIEFKIMEIDLDSPEPVRLHHAETPTHRVRIAEEAPDTGEDCYYTVTERKTGRTVGNRLDCPADIDEAKDRCTALANGGAIADTEEQTTRRPIE